MTESAAELPVARPSRLFGTLALVAGVIGAVISWLGWGFLLPILAIVLALVARRRERSPKALWIPALLLGIAGLIVSVISLFVQYLALMATIGFSAG